MNIVQELQEQCEMLDMEARLIGESTAGMTAVEIYDDDRLVWSYRWFAQGCDSREYVEGLIDAMSTLAECQNVLDYGNGDINANGDPVSYDAGDTTGVMLIYNTASGWHLGEDARSMGQQSSEIVDVLMLAGVLALDGEMDAENPVVLELARGWCTKSAARLRK